MLLNYACATAVFKLLSYFSLVLYFMERYLNTTVLFRMLCACFVLLFVYAYSYVGFKSSLEFAMIV